MITPAPGDPTPIVGAQTDIAPLGRSGSKPAHELTADEERGNIDWSGIDAREDFQALLREKARFIVPACVFFVCYYFALPLLVGYRPEWMKTKILGPLNLAYLFALSQFFMAWGMAFLYVRAAARWDKKSADILNKVGKR